jgi:hypothetical protein
MAEYPPFMNAYGLVSKILPKIKEAKTPDRFTQDYLAKTLGFAGGSAKPFIPLAKRLGLLASDGKPTELYAQFRNANHSKGALAQAIRKGYSDLFTRNENVNTLDRKALEGLVIQATGLDAGSATLRAIVGTFENLKKLAEFNGAPIPAGKGETTDEGGDSEDHIPSRPPDYTDTKPLGVSLMYTINLVLPKTDDVAVFNAIFRSLRDNLLNR